MPAIAAPSSGASQNTQSCAGAPSPLKNATPVERAGLTDVFDIGIEIRWINVSVRPIDKPANPFGARSSVEPRMTRRKTPVRTTSAMITAHSEKPPGECSPNPLAAILPCRPGQPSCPLAITQIAPPAPEPPDPRGDPVGGKRLPPPPPRERRAQCDGGVEVAAGDSAERVHAGEHRQAEGQCDTEETDSERCAV